MKASKIMTDDVIYLHGEDTISMAVEKLASRGISGAPVVDGEGKLVGILSEKDILNAMKVRYKRLEMIYPSLSMVSVSFVEKFDDKEAKEAFIDIANSQVSDLMNPEPYTIQEDDSVSHVIDIMNKKSVNRIPVLKDDKLVGIITRKDVIKGLAVMDNLQELLSIPPIE